MAILDEVKGKRLSYQERADLAVKLAAYLIDQANHNMTWKEKRKSKQFARMMDDANGKLFITHLTDQCFRARSSVRASNQVRYLIDTYGIPRFLSPLKRGGLFFFKHLSKVFPRLSMAMLKSMLKRETHDVIIDEKRLETHIKARSLEGVRMNINHLGEAILGEEEAEKRLQLILNDLSKPEIEYISVKISGIFSQINLLAWDDTVKKLSSRLRRLYKAAENSRPPKFINLDMEEYRDLELTVEVFQTVLEEFPKISAGIVLQAYLPDSFPIQKRLTAWAKERVAKGGSPIKIRLVKGANLAQEKVEASLQNWQQAPYHTKLEADADFKEMLEYGLELENCKAAHIGIGSHNIFDIAYGLILRAENCAEPYVEFEMLEGMADHLRRVVQKISGTMVLYCPVVNKENFVSAIAYLIRRLDENTGPSNFLRSSFNIAAGSDSFKEQEKQFRASIGIRLEHESNRRKKKALSQFFTNEPNTDWSLRENRESFYETINHWSFDKGYKIADEKEALNAVQRALEAKKPSGSLQKAAERFRKSRGDLITAMMNYAAKTAVEADAEVSEAIDLIEYYARCQEAIAKLEGIQCDPKGVVLVAPPWNFPCSIPVSGIASALATGNKVIFKPAMETIPIGWVLVKLFWDSGFDQDCLQFLPADDEPVGTLLIKDPRINTVVLTGSTETAKLFMKMRPGIDLLGETGGKNSIIVTALADKELAIKDIITSAFSHAGQKCSACSLLILEKEVYEDPRFLRQIKDAASSLSVGPVLNLANRMGPLIHPPGEALLRALTTLEEGETWLLKPKQDLENPCLWTPGIKLGVSQGSFTYMNELFGPVLGVMRADNLEHAIALANGTPYGLTAGLHSLDPREQFFWKDKIQAGNLYINRSITGAVVLRQPFGGCKESHFGGFKAGGPNTLFALQTFSDTSLPKEKEEFPKALALFEQSINKTLLNPHERALLDSSFRSYSFYQKHYFSLDLSTAPLIGQDNSLSYRVEENLSIRFCKNDDPVRLLQVLGALYLLNASFYLSIDPEMARTIKDLIPLQKAFVENESAFCQRVENYRRGLIRTFKKPSEALEKSASLSFSLFIHDIPSSHGRVELVKYLREIALSFDYNRYGNLGENEYADDRIS